MALQCGCGASLAQDDKFCSACGLRVPAACRECGLSLDPTAKFCSRCGAPASVQKESSGITAEIPDTEEAGKEPSNYEGLYGISGSASKASVRPSPSENPPIGSPGGPKNYSAVTGDLVSKSEKGFWWLWAGGILAFIVLVVSLGTSAETEAERLANELCDIGIINVQPATVAGAERWEDFEAKGAELLAMESAGDLRYIGAAAQQLGANTRAEVRRGGGNNVFYPEYQAWHEVVSDSWKRSGDVWAELCLEYGAYD